MKAFQPITKTIWIISLVSLFTDFAGEMLYPVMPLYLKSIGYSVLAIGILEGFAEAVAGLGKSYFGMLSDASGKRLPFVRFGYLLSAISKPMLAASTQLWWIFAARFTDRAGKGLRTAPRDALLSDEANQSNRATVFGFHRAMDTFGAVLGPLAALIFLYFNPGSYQYLFLLATAPGMAAIVCTWLIKEKATQAVIKKSVPFHQTFNYIRHAPDAYKKLIACFLLFGLYNSSDIFLLLKMKESGLSDTVLIGVYIFYNLIFALFSFPVGRLADQYGMKYIFITGLLLFAVTYAGFSLANTPAAFWVLFSCYGVYAAATEGVAKAWISNLVPKNETASAIGFYTGMQSIAALLASSLAGFIWFRFGSGTVFMMAAFAAIITAFWIFFQFRHQK